MSPHCIYCWSGTKCKLRAREKEAGSDGGGAGGGGVRGTVVEAFSSFGKERAESRPPSGRKVSHPQIGFVLKTVGCEEFHVTAEISED